MCQASRQFAVRLGVRGSRDPRSLIDFAIIERGGHQWRNNPIVGTSTCPAPCRSWRRVPGTTPITGLTPGPASSQPVSVGFSTFQQTFDLIDLLTPTAPAAVEKLRMLRQRRDDGHALTIEFEEVRQ